MQDFRVFWFCSKNSGKIRFKFEIWKIKNQRISLWYILKWEIYYKTSASLSPTALLPYLPSYIFKYIRGKWSNILKLKVKHFSSPGERLRTQLLKGPIDFYILFLWLGNVFWVFKNTKIIGLVRFSKKLYCDSGWVDGWVISYPLRFRLFSGMSSSIVWLW